MENESYRNVPPVTTVLIGINLLLWIFLELKGETQSAGYMLEHGASYFPFIVGKGEWWRLFTCMFLHFGANHLINNMLMLGVLGFRLEHTLGNIPFGILYLLSGLCGNLLSLYEEMGSGDYAVSAGASGAVFGVMGALVAWALWHKGRVEGLSMRGLLGMTALSLYYGFSTAGIDNMGHIGGFLGGFVLASIFSIISKIVDFRGQ